jgi:hypothetical protein
MEVFHRDWLIVSRHCACCPAALVVSTSESHACSEEKRVGGRFPTQGADGLPSVRHVSSPFTCSDSDLNESGKRPLNPTPPGQPRFPGRASAPILNAQPSTSGRTAKIR